MARIFAAPALLGLAVSLLGGSSQSIIAGSPAVASPVQVAAADPAAKTLVSADQDASDWLLAGHDYGNNRYVSSTITKANVGSLGLGWMTASKKPLPSCGAGRCIFRRRITTSSR